jgi:hypothetical protein
MQAKNNARTQEDATKVLIKTWQPADLPQLEIGFYITIVFAHIIISFYKTYAFTQRLFADDNYNEHFYQRHSVESSIIPGLVTDNDEEWCAFLLCLTYVTKVFLRPHKPTTGCMQ